MTSTLEELQTKLYAAFDGAISRSEYTHTDSAARSQHARTAAEVAQAIAAVDARLDDKAQAKNGICLPGKLARP